MSPFVMKKVNNLPLTIHTEMLKLSILPVVKGQIEYSNWPWLLKPPLTQTFFSFPSEFELPRFYCVVFFSSKNPIYSLFAHTSHRCKHYYPKIMYQNHLPFLPFTRVIFKSFHTPVSHSKSKPGLIFSNKYTTLLFSTILNSSNAAVLVVKNDIYVRAAVSNVTAST